MYNIVLHNERENNSFIFAMQISDKANYSYGKEIKKLYKPE